MMSKFSYFKDVKTKKLFHTSAKSKIVCKIRHKRPSPYCNRSALSYERLVAINHMQSIKFLTIFLNLLAISLDIEFYLI